MNGTQYAILAHVIGLTLLLGYAALVLMRARAARRLAKAPGASAPDVARAPAETAA
jgi:hypothetical protein